MDGLEECKGCVVYNEHKEYSVNNPCKILKIIKNNNEVKCPCWNCIVKIICKTSTCPYINKIMKEYPLEWR